MASTVLVVMWLSSWPVVIVCCYLLYKGFQICFSPMNYMHKYAGHPVNQFPLSTGGMRLGSKSVGLLPPPYPNGWFRVMDSSDVPPVGESKHVEALGEHLAIFRNASGHVRALHAYCPHLGANLGVSGRLSGKDCIECPFHGWKFDGLTGQCTSIPYSDAPIPSTARVRAFSVEEAHGHVYVWFDAEERPPQWKIPLVPDIISGAAAMHGRSEEHVRCHVQEIPENGADTAHLDVLHAPFVIPGFSSLFSHGWKASWRAGDDHRAYMAVQQWWKCGKWSVPGSAIDVTVTQIGPGIVHLHFKTFLGSVTVIECVTPVAPLLQKYYHSVYARWTVPRPICKLILRGLVIQSEKDIPVWNHKQFNRKPLVVKGDGPLLQFRRWYKQFYSAKSKSREQVQDALLQW